MFHYVYRITNKKDNKHYYGVRSSKIEPKLDLGFKYFSSSHDKLFILDQKENNNNYKYKVLKLFKTKTEAIQFEIKLHKKFNVGKNLKFYNKCNQTSSKFSNISYESIKKMKLTLNTIQSDGLTISHRANKNRLEMTENGLKIYKNNMTYNQYYGYSSAQTRKSYQTEINKKVSTTKMLKSKEDKEKAKNKFIETMNKIEENGLTKMKIKSLKHSEIMKNKTKEEKELSKHKFITTMNKIGSDGLTGFERRVLKRKMNKEINEKNSK